MSFSNQSNRYLRYIEQGFKYYVLNVKLERKNDKDELDVFLKKILLIKKIYKKKKKVGKKIFK